MQHIRMRPCFKEKIESGLKSATTRYGVKDIYNIGDAIIEYERGISDTNVYIDKIELIEFREINETLALKEGFETSLALKKVLIDIYGPQSSDNLFTVIHFRKGWL